MYKNLLRILLATVVTLCVAVVVAVHLPSVRQAVAERIASELSRTLGTRVAVGDVEIELFNRVVLRDVVVEDQAGQPMLTSQHAAASVLLGSLLSDRILITQLELFHTSGTFYRPTPEAPANFQFALDSLMQPSDPDEPSVSVQIKTLLVRDMALRYDVQSLPQTPGRFNASHLNLEHINANLRLNQLKRDTINLRLRDLALQERQSGLDIKSMAFRLMAGSRSARLQGFRLDTRRSTLRLDDVAATGRGGEAVDFAQLDVDGLHLEGRLCPEEFTTLAPALDVLGAQPLHLDARLSRHGQALAAQMRLAAQNSNDLALQTSLQATLADNGAGLASIDGQIASLTVSAPLAKQVLERVQPEGDWGEQLARLGTLQQKGSFRYANHEWTLQGETQTALGTLTERLYIKGERLQAHVRAQQLQLGALLGQSALGHLTGEVEASGTLRPLHLGWQSDIASLALNGYNYTNAKLQGTVLDKQLSASLRLDDPNGQIQLDAQCLLDGQRPLQLNGLVQSLNPHALALTERWEGQTFSGVLSAALSTMTGNPEGHVALRRVQMEEPESEGLQFDSLRLDFQPDGNGTDLHISSDMMSGYVHTDIPLQRLPQAIGRQIGQALPQLFDQPRATDGGEDEGGQFHLDIHNAVLAERLLGLPVSLASSATLHGSFNTADNRFTATLSLPQFAWDGTDYSQGSLYLAQRDRAVELLAKVNRRFGDNDIHFEVTSQAHDDHVETGLFWRDQTAAATSGAIHATTTFDRTADDELLTNIQISPSQFLIGDSVWQIASASLQLQSGDYLIDHLNIYHRGQYIQVYSIPSTVAGGHGLKAELNDIDVDYVYNLIDYQSLDFGGRAFGTVTCGNLSSDDIDFSAQLRIDRFTFNGSEMGTLRVTSDWDGDDKRITFDGLARRGADDSTRVAGFVDLDDKLIDIGIEAQMTYAGFLNKYLKNIFDPITGYCTGHCRLSGTLKDVDIVGDIVVLDLQLAPKALGAVYHVPRDTVHMTSGSIAFHNFTLYDEVGGTAKLNGAVRHDYLRHFTYDFQADAEHLLAYDWSGAERSDFWGHVLADGYCLLFGDLDKVNIEAHIAPAPGTSFVYNSASTGGEEDREFIRFRSPRQLREQRRTAGLTATAAEQTETRSEKDTSTDILMDLYISANPNAAFKVLTDARNNDHILLYGNGDLHVSYYNKGGFGLYGAYVLTGGKYDITMQDVIHKQFEMQPGGALRFSGEASKGTVDMQGIYAVNSVSLNDLNLSNLSSSTTTAHCILNFKGYAMTPEISFDLDFPNVGDDEKLMVRNLIASQGDINMQAVYLLGIGRFFTYDYASYRDGTGGADQGSVAMQSLLVSTLGNQLSNVLDNAFRLKGWTFGTNLATSPIGWSGGMEVDGLVRGSLLNNRLLVDGQFGYRDQTIYANNFVGDFNVRWLLNKSGSISLKGYSETNDRYFTRSSLTTNGAGILFRREFNGLKDLLFNKSK